MSLISENMSWDNYKYIFGRSSLLPKWFLNSFIAAVIGTAVNVFINTMAGYSLTRLSFPGRDKIYHGLLLLMMVPSQALLIPNYLISQKMGLLDSYASLILPAAANVGNIFLMRQFFMNFPKEVEEAASIDGLGRYARFFRICMPLAKPTIATQAIFVFMGSGMNLRNQCFILKQRLNIRLPWDCRAFRPRMQEPCGIRLWRRHVYPSSRLL